MPSFSVEKIKGIAGPLPALRGGVWEGKLPLERSGKVGRTALVTTRMSLADAGAERSKPDRKRVSLTCGIKKQTTKEKCRTHRNEKNGGSQGLEAGGMVGDGQRVRTSSSEAVLGSSLQHQDRIVYSTLAKTLAKRVRFKCSHRTQRK